MSGRSPEAMVEIGGTPRLARAPDVWVRWSWIWQVIFYSMLGLALVLTIALPAGPRTPLTVALALVLGGWYWLVVGRRGVCHGQNRRTLVYFGGALPLWYVLAGLHPAFYLVLFSFYNQAYTLLTLRWAVLLSVGLSLLSVWPLIVSEPLASNWIALLIVALSTALGAVLATWLSAIIAQSNERQRLIEALEQTQAELRGAERQAGMLEERQRLAGEIHDTLAQGFTSIVMHLEAADAALGPTADIARHHLEQARGTARESLAEARRVIWTLRPDLHAAPALPDALSHLAARWAAETGISATATATGRALPLRPDVEIVLLRVAREALANVRKHAQASAVVVTLSYMDDLAMLDIQDNGIGAAPHRMADGASQSGGFGLPAIRERVDQIGGTLAIESVPGEGTTLVVEVPLDERTLAVPPASPQLEGRAP